MTRPDAPALPKSFSQKLRMAMPEAIPTAWTDAFLQQRALWLSAFPDDQPEATRASCEQANRWVRKFSEDADRGKRPR